MFFFSNKRKMINKSIKKIICSEKLKKIKNLKLNSDHQILNQKFIIKLLSF